MIRLLFVLFSFLIAGLAAPVSKTDFGPVVIFDPPANYTAQRTLYARSLLLTNGDLLATWENYSPAADGNPYFPIYKSKDGGQTWSPYSKVEDQVNGWGLRYQPFLYELPSSIGGYKKGDLLLAGNSIPEDLSETQIDLYASRDQGQTWAFVSHIASGGRAIPNNGETPVWEPFLMLHNNQLVCYYSDQRDPSYGQKMSHQVTSDLATWGPVVTDVAYPTYDFRPGMPTVSELPDGTYIMTYEFYGATEGAFSVYYKISADPLAFGSQAGVVLRSTDGNVPSSSPYNVWTPVGGDNGSIVVNAGSSTDVFVSTDLGKSWVRQATSAPESYTRSLRVMKDDSKVLIVGGGPITGDGSTNEVTATQITV